MNSTIYDPDKWQKYQDETWERLRRALYWEGTEEELEAGLRKMAGEKEKNHDRA